MAIGYEDLWLSERVQELLAEGTLSRLLAQVKKEVTDEWASTPPEDTRLREDKYHELHALGRLHIRMEILINQLKYPQVNNGSGN
ncbi:hypothetical protein DNAM_60 [Pseudomonas phage BroderSalsa]|nr:hypothetical protein DNAM_60 [Pseudomonas phage BroderSalsa]